MVTSDPALEDDRRVTFGSWWMLAILMILYIFSILHRVIITLLVDPIQSSLHLTDFQMSILLGPAFAVFYGLFGIPLGWAADRYPRRWVIYLGVTAFSAAAMLTGAAVSFTQMVFSRIAVGIGEASLTPAAMSLLADKFPRRRLTTAVSIYQASVKLGLAIAFGLGAATIAAAKAMENVHIPFFGHLDAWAIVFVLTGAPGLVLALLIFTFSEPPRRGRKADAAPPKFLEAVPFYRANAKVLLQLAGGFGLIAIAGAAMTAWTPTYMNRAFHWTAVQAGPALSIISLLTASTLVFKGALIDWLYQRGTQDIHVRFYTWLLVGGIPLSVATFMVGSPFLFVILYGIIQVIVAPYLIYITTTIQLVTPAQFRGQLTAIFLMVFAVAGSGIGPVLTAFLTDYVLGGPQMLGYAMMIVIVGTMIGTLLFLRASLPNICKAVGQQALIEV
jgi:MFS family permease